MPDEKNASALFVKIHGIEQLTENKISIDIEVIAVDNKGGLASRPIELIMNKKTHQLATMANGKLRAELIFPIRSDARQHLLAKIHGQEEANTILELVPPCYEEVLKEKIREDLRKEKKVDDSQLNGLFSEIAGIIKDSRQKLEKKKFGNIAKFYENLIVKNYFSHIPHHNKSIYEISEEIFSLHRDLKSKALELLTFPNWTLRNITGSPYTNDAIKILKEMGVSSIIVFRKELELLPTYITNPHHKYSLKSTKLGEHAMPKSKTLNRFFKKIEDAQYYLTSLEKGIEKHITSGCDFNKKIAEVITASSDNEIPQEIEKILRSYTDESILQAYSFLNASNFRSIGEVVTFEQDRYKILSKDVTGLFERVERISKYLAQQNYTLAWVTFEQLLKSIRSDKEIADVIGIKQFESEFDDCIQKLRSRFEVS